MKVFLSHSSKQKNYVEIVANKLGKNKIIYDKYSFEAGEKTLDEIYKGIEVSGIFVFFISKDSLNSIWVQKEILRAEEFIKNGKLKKFLPIIIDPDITHNDSSIPQWIKDSYNLKYFSKPTKVYDLIRQSLVLVNWDLYPNKKELNQLFIGRTTQIKEFEQRIYDFNLPSPSTIVISGLYNIGRRKFLKHALTNSNNISQNYEAPSIFLDNRNSIEDFIIKLYGLGYSEVQNDQITNLSTKDIDTKVEIAFQLLLELEKNNDILLVVDSFSIISSNGQIVDWYLKLLDKLKNIDKILVCIISNSKLKVLKYLSYTNLFSINIPELEPYERASLFQALLKLDNLSINRINFSKISNLFSGYPEQITFTTELLKQEGEHYLTEHLNEIIDYNSEKVSRVLRNFSDNKLAIQILKILSDSECISILFLREILGTDFNEAETILSDFSNSFIIEFLGSNKEFIRLNDSIKDYIQRINYTLDAKYNQNINNHIKNNFQKYESLESDTSEYILTVKESLKRNLNIPKEFLIPSHYLNAMRELYNNERRYNDVIVLADRILLNENYLDKKIVKEIRYWLCLALSRKRDERLLKEVQFIDGADHSFLLGFYYRMRNRNDDAIERFNEVLKINSKFYRAKRELVQVYINVERYSDALFLAKDSYLIDKNNPFNLQSYFRCLIKTDGFENKHELKQLLLELKKNPHEKAREMFLTCKAQYECFIEGDIYNSLNHVNDAISIFTTNIYPYLTKLDILKKFELYSELEKFVNEINEKFDKDSDIFSKLMYIKSLIYISIYRDDKENALKIYYSKIEGKYNNSVYDNILFEINKI